MSLLLHYHPLSSFCQKVLVALYENDTPFEPLLVDLGNAAERAALVEIWPPGKFPVLQDRARGQIVPESSIIIEYLAQHFPGRTELLPHDSDLARHTRLRDRFFDLEVNVPMQKIVGDRLRPAGRKNSFGVEQARAQLGVALDMTDKDMAGKTWATGDAFSMADCAAAPALYYANLVSPFTATHKNVARYFERLMQRPSFKRTVEEAAPYRHLFPSG